MVFIPYYQGVYPLAVNDKTIAIRTLYLQIIFNVLTGMMDKNEF
jgi:hypothetical protein